MSAEELLAAALEVRRGRVTCPGCFRRVAVDEGENASAVLRRHIDNGECRA